MAMTEVLKVAVKIIKWVNACKALTAVCNIQLSTQEMLTIHITTMYCTQRALQYSGSFILHPVSLSQPPCKTGIFLLLKNEGTKAQWLPYLLMVTQLIDG